MRPIASRRLGQMSPLATIVLLLVVALVTTAPTRVDHGPATSMGDHLGLYNWHVEIENVDAGNVVSVQGLGVEQEVAEVGEDDDPLIRKVPGRLRYANVTLKRGYATGDALHDWVKQSLLSSPIQEPQRRSMAITLIGNEGREIARYDLVEAWPCGWKGISADGNGNGILTEEIVVCSERFEES